MNKCVRVFKGIQGAPSYADRYTSHCGVDCSCCEYGDGTAPVDHARYCDLITMRDGLAACTCEIAGEQALRRKAEEQD